MADREEEKSSSIVEPLNIKEQAKDRSHAADTKEEYDRIL